MGVLGLSLLMPPTAWSDTRFEMEPGKVVLAEILEKGIGSVLGAPRLKTATIIGDCYSEVVPM